MEESTERNEQVLRVKRNKEIVRLYEEGQGLLTIGNLHGLTKERIRQIIKLAGVELRRPGHPGERTRTNFLGVEVTDETKEALRVEAKRRGISMSSLTDATLREMLEQVEGTK